MTETPSEDEERSPTRKQLLEQVMAEGVSREVAAFADFFEIPVLVQLKHALVMPSFSGTWQPVSAVQTENAMLLGVPEYRLQKEGKDDPGVYDAQDILGPGPWLGPVFLEPNNTGLRLTILLQFPEATLRTTVDPEDVRYVTRVDPTTVGVLQQRRQYMEQQGRRIVTP